MLYTLDTFLKPISGDEFTIVIRNPELKPVHSIEVSRITSQAVQGVILLIKVDTDDKVIGIEFSTQAEAKSALKKLQQAIDIAKLNQLKIDSVLATTPITLDNFNTLVSNNAINSYSFYTITDENNTLGTGVNAQYDIVSFGSESNDFIALNKNNGELYRINTLNNTAVPLDGTIIYEQATPALIWEIQHPFTKNPSVTIVNTAGTANLEGFISYPTTSSVRIEFGIAVNGIAYLN
jgi:uncharacterized protein YuzE